MLASYPDKIWWIGLLLTFSGIVVGISAIKNYITAKKEKKISDAQMEIISLKTKTAVGVEGRVEILANWLYSVSEWKAFMKWERKERGSTTLMETILIIVPGTFAIRVLKAGDWGTALAISLFIGVLYGVIKYIITLSSLHLGENKMPEVIITKEAVIVNGHLNRFRGNNLWLGKVAVNDAGSFNILEITYCWNTRKGQSFDEIRVPIPKGYLKEAIFLEERLMK